MRGVRLIEFAVWAGPFAASAAGSICAYRLARPSAGSPTGSVGESLDRGLAPCRVFLMYSLSACWINKRPSPGMAGSGLSGSTVWRARAIRRIRRGPRSNALRSGAPERFHRPTEMRDAMKVVAHYYGIDPEELEGLLDSIVPLLGADSN